MFPGLSMHPTILSAVPHQGPCSLQKPPSSPTMRGDTPTSQASTPTHKSKPGKRYARRYRSSRIRLTACLRSHQVTDAVHAKGSYIFLQLWALGRIADVGFLEKQDPPIPYVSASSVVLTGRPKAPRSLTEVEIKDYIAAYARAASNAVHGAGFDGVEIHGANGYLPDQFLQTTSNKRTDQWGGDEHGRTRFVREIIDAIVGAVGQDRVGIRISPWSAYQGEVLALMGMLLCSFMCFPGMGMPDPRPTFAYLVTALRDKHPKLAYLHVIEPRVAGDRSTGPSDVDVPNQNENNDFLREIWNGGEGSEERAFISAGGYTRETALRTAESMGGLIAFGRLYISNVSVPILSFSSSVLICPLDDQPDLPVRLRENIPLTPGDRSKYYLGGNLTPFGYNDWPFADGSVREIDGKL